MGKKAPALTLPQFRLLSSAVLPMNKFDTVDLIDLVSWIPMKNHRVYLAHRKRKLAALKVSYFALPQGHYNALPLCDTIDNLTMKSTK
ncbi:MAG: hypothetical protein NT047_06270 [Deltaproteobacteria bacterium]|nr:hypothetical protein [Deltaproteobacteria bacterium]